MQIYLNRNHPLGNNFGYVVMLTAAHDIIHDLSSSGDNVSRMHFFLSHWRKKKDLTTYPKIDIQFRRMNQINNPQWNHCKYIWVAKWKNVQWSDLFE